MRGVTLIAADGVALEVKALRGELRRTDATHPVTFDDTDSFIIHIDSAEISIDTGSLTRLLNSYVFAYNGAPLRNISVAFTGGRIVQKAMMHKGIDMPVEIVGAISATEDGNMLLHADKIKAAHLPVKGLLDLLGKDLASILDAGKAHGARIEGDNVILLPGSMIPRLHLEGKVSKVYLEGNRLVQVFGRGLPSAPLKPPLAATAYIYHRGGVLRFGKLTMDDADLELVRMDLQSPFEFCPTDYNRQLVAGYSKNTLSHGLIVRMPNYTRIKK